MKNKTVLFLFIIGFVLWYANRKKASPVATNNSGSTGTTATPQTSNLVAGPPVGVSEAPISYGMTNGVPNWLKGVGYSMDANSHETSLWFDSQLVPKVTIQLTPGLGNATGSGWSSGTPILASNLTLGSYKRVVRLNPVSVSQGGILSGTKYFVTIENPQNDAEKIIVQFTTIRTNTDGIINIPLVATTITAPVEPIVIPAPTGNGFTVSGVQVNHPEVMNPIIAWRTVNGQKFGFVTDTANYTPRYKFNLYIGGVPKPIPLDQYNFLPNTHVSLHATDQQNGDSWQEILGGKASANIVFGNAPN